MNSQEPLSFGDLTPVFRKIDNRSYVHLAEFPDIAAIAHCDMAAEDILRARYEQILESGNLPLMNGPDLPVPRSRVSIDGAPPLWP